MNCKCGKQIPEERLEFYDYCIQCSNEKPKLGFMEDVPYTNGEIRIVANDEINQNAIRNNRRVLN